ncbi:LLM class flavin-dependent oxidoreductase [Nocardioides sp. C4-1]|uniref:LLM class flavin-dependent oxidoreductase n=1 Tax=Nocardioides sp. C4-1 TaxID=3151851 RepID=UPI0032669F4A
MEHGLACSFASEAAGGLADRVEEAAAAAEAAGLSSWWSLGEREVVADRSFDPVLGLQCVARATSRLRIGLSGELLAVQPAAVRAKQIASLDFFGGGRVELGLDLADPPPELVDPEHDDADHLGRALERLDAMSALWTMPRAAHAGERFAFHGASALPRPVGGRVPTVHLRGASAEVLRRYVSVIGTPAGRLAWRETPDELAAGQALVTDVLGAAADDVRHTWFVDPDALDGARRAVAGGDVRVDELVVVLDHVPSTDEVAALAPVTA